MIIKQETTLLQRAWKGISNDEISLSANPHLLAARLGEDVPEAERLVAGARDDGLAVGRHGQVQHAVRVAGELGHLAQRRVPPHQDLVLAVAVRGHLREEAGG